MNEDQIANLAGNMIVYARQVFRLAMEQYNADFEAGSRSNSRSQLLGEIGSYAFDLAKICKQIAGNAGMLKEIPIDTDDVNDPAKAANWQIWLVPDDSKAWHI